MDTIQTKEDILNIILSHKEEIENFGIKRVGLFGSFLKGKQDADSDVDLLVEFAPGKKNFKNFMNLAFFLEDLLHRRVEIVTMESISPYLKPNILKEVEYVLQ